MLDEKGNQVFEPADDRFSKDKINAIFNQLMSDLLRSELTLGVVRRALKASTLRYKRGNKSYIKKLVNEYEVQTKRNFERDSKFLIDLEFLDFSFVETPVVPEEFGEEIIKVEEWLLKMNLEGFNTVIKTGKRVHSNIFSVGHVVQPVQIMGTKPSSTTKEGATIAE